MHIFPTRDIHLVQAAGLDGEIHLSFFNEDPVTGAWTDVSTIANVVIRDITPNGQPHVATFRRTNNPSTPQDSPTGLSIGPSPDSVGVSFVSATILLPLQQSKDHALRVTTHSDITRIFLAQHSLTMLAGERNVVLSVFGEFPDAAEISTWDISEHPYLEFSSDDLTVAEVDTTGRLNAIAPGMATIHAWITGRRAATDQICTVVVDSVPARLGRLDIKVETQHAPRGATQRCFFLSEGYADAAVFASEVRRVVDKWLRAEANSPFRWVRGRIRVISVFDRTLEQGIAVACPIGFSGGDPSGPENVTYGPGTPRDITFVAARMTAQPTRDTRFGLIYGARLGDPHTKDSNAADWARNAGDEWLRPRGKYVGESPWASPVREDRTIVVDHRRLSPYRDGVQRPVAFTDPRVAFADFLRRYLLAVGFPATDEDWIVFLVDDQYRAGARLAIAGLEPAANRRVAMTNASDNRGFDGATFPIGTPWMRRTPQRKVFHAGWVGSSVTHEIAHTLGLGDEYENVRSTVDPTPANRVALLEYDNLQLYDDLFVLGHLEVSRIKWHVDRVRHASTVLTVVRVPGVAAFYELALVGDPRRLWKVNDTAVLRTSFARPGSTEPNLPRLREHLVVVTNVTDVAVTVINTSVEPIDEEEMSGSAVLYVPRTTETGARVKLIDPAVVSYLQTTDRAFPKPAACNVSTAVRHSINEEEVRPPPIPGVKMPSRPGDLIGVYEGGYDIACGIARPAGRCKLRRSAVYDLAAHKVKEVWPFCFVCKFVIVDRIDPGQHGHLDDEYPRDC